MEEITQEQVIRTFDEMEPIYAALTRKMEVLIQELLNNLPVKVQSVTSRTKERKSFINKFSKGLDKYKKLEDITDLSGIRITCWFLDQIPLIEEIIKENFKINGELSINKKEIMDPDKFGYLSIHYIVSISSSRE